MTSISSSVWSFARPSVCAQGFCFADVTTGELVIGQEKDGPDRAFLAQLLGMVSPRELPHAQLSQPARPIHPAVAQTAPAHTLPAPAVVSSAGQPSAAGTAPMQQPASRPLPAYLQSFSAAQRAPAQREGQGSASAWTG